ncbi:hypothetical protein TNCV_3057241 [Trichonephila clavipes]|nr:hypothetical protein TNCV_3057241 [Trichonephila clavipes]
MCIYPPSNKVATIPEDAIANAVFCCDRKFVRLRQQIQQLQGMKIRTLGWNTKPFYLIPVISNIVTTVSEIRYQIIVVHPEMHPMPTSASQLLKVRSLTGRDCRPVLSGKITGVSKIDFRVLFPTQKNTLPSSRILSSRKSTKSKEYVERHIGAYENGGFS